jgi:hypothetical protein
MPQMRTGRERTMSNKYPFAPAAAARTRPPSRWAPGVPGGCPGRRGRTPVPAVTAAVIALALLASVIPAAETRIERRVFIPSKELGLLARDGKPGILLTAEEYERLLEESGADRPEPAEIPFPANVAAVDAEGTFEQAGSEGDEALRVKAAYTVRVLSATWGEVPFVLRDASPISLKTGGKWFVGADRADLPPHLFVYGPGDHDVELEFLAPVRQEAGERRATFTMPAAPAGSLTLRLPGSNDVRSSLPVHVTRKNG